MKRAFTAARAIATWLGRVPSLIWAGLYLGAIPLFGWVYSTVPDGFYHSASRFEVSVTQEIKAVAALMTQEYTEIMPWVLKWPRTILLTETLDARKRRLEFAFADMEFHNIRPTGETSLLVDFGTVGYAGGRGANFGFSGIDGTITIDMSDYGVWWGRIPTRQVVVESSDSDEIDVSALFRCEPGSLWEGRDEKSSETSCLALLEPTWERLRHLGDGLRGFPQSVRGQFWRMTYFSAVTISTLGYGDIIPISDRARSLVTVEVVLGPVLFGLFLNSLFKERSKND